MWGHRFTNIVNFDRENGVYEIDYEHFDDTISVSWFSWNRNFRVKKRFHLYSFC